MENAVPMKWKTPGSKAVLTLWYILYFFKAEVSSFRYKKQNAHIGLVLNSVQTAVYSGPCSQRTLTN